MSYQSSIKVHLVEAGLSLLVFQNMWSGSRSSKGKGRYELPEFSEVHLVKAGLPLGLPVLVVIHIHLFAIAALLPATATRTCATDDWDMDRSATVNHDHL